MRVRGGRLDQAQMVGHESRTRRVSDPQSLRRKSHFSPAHSQELCHGERFHECLQPCLMVTWTLSRQSQGQEAPTEAVAGFK